MSLTQENIDKLNTYSKEVTDQTNQCNITGTLFTYGELVKLGHEVLKDNRSADDFSKVNHISQLVLKDVVDIFQSKCGCKRLR